jgi:hypothetical protein
MSEVSRANPFIDALCTGPGLPCAASGDPDLLPEEPSEDKPASSDPLDPDDDLYLPGEPKDDDVDPDSNEEPE